MTVALPSWLQMSVNAVMRFVNQRIGACWPIPPTYHEISVIAPFTQSTPKKPSVPPEVAGRCGVSRRIRSSSSVCAYVRRQPFSAVLQTYPLGNTPRGFLVLFESILAYPLSGFDHAVCAGARR